jgi:hypothetical protein
MASAVDSGQCYISNSLLCFVLTKFKALEMSRIKSTVLDFYSFDDITVAKNVLLDAVNDLHLDKPLFRYLDRHGTDRTVRQLDDIFDILVNLDERMVLNKLPAFVTVNSDNLPSPRMDEGELRTLMNKINKVEAILYSLQTAVHSIHASLDCVINKVSTITTTTEQLTQSVAGKTIGLATVQPDTLGNPTRNVNIGVSGQQSSQSSLVPKSKARWSDAVVEQLNDAGTTNDSGDDFTVYESRRHRLKRRKQSSGSPQPSQQSSSAVSVSGSGHTVRSGSGSGSQSQSNVRSFRQPLVVGKRCVNVGHVGAAKPYKAVFCIDNLSMSVDTVKLTNFVSSLGVRVLSCFEAKPRLTARQRERGIKVERKTFRLCINRADTNTLLNPDVWPSDVSIFRWFFKQSTQSSSSTKDPASASENILSLSSVVANNVTDDVESASVDMDTTIVGYFHDAPRSDNSLDTVPKIL